MTIQPVETEQQYLGNEPTRGKLVRDLLDDAQATGEAAAKTLQHYAPGAHLRRPSWAPADDTELAALARKSINANKLLGIARAEAIRAETEFQTALAVEAEASGKALESAEALLAYTRKAAGMEDAAEDAK